MKKRKNDLIKLAESIEALADAIEKEASEEKRHVKTAAERRASLDYGTVGDRYSGSGASDPITAFALS